ncbi:MAG: NAD(P)-dependent oxidoreductase [Bacteroidetes bacterium]|nr:NAD(P)-dependent oxidoreductase [Bacteroidota bacterium]MCA6442013.1 NAD(P)-dependent oxidoreductase [Bacteroidota bacterium]
MTKQRIIITGANGFIGSHLVSKLVNKYHVIGIDHHSTGKSGNYHQINLLDVDVEQFQHKWEGDVFIHLASVMANAQNLIDISVVNQNNTMSFNAANLAVQLKCKHFINLSSSSVYPNINGIFTEDSIIDPSQNTDAFYGLSKFNSEVIIDKLLMGRLKVTHLRSSMIYGEGVNSSRIWPVMEKELKEQNTVTVYGNGERLINQLHINSLLSIIENVIVRSITGKYNIKDETISTKKLAERIISQKGNPESKIVLINEGNMSKFELDNSKYNSL